MSHHDNTQDQLLQQAQQRQNAVANYTPQTSQITGPYFNALQQGGAALDQKLLNPAAYAGFMRAGSLAQKMRAYNMGSGASGFASQYADPNLVRTQNEEAQRQQDQNLGLGFMQAAGNTYNQNVGLLGQQDSQKLNALSGAASDANNLFASYVNRPQRPGFFSSLLSGAFQVAAPGLSTLFGNTINGGGSQGSNNGASLIAADPSI